MKNQIRKPDKRQSMKRRLLRQEVDEALLDAYLGSCPKCGGSVFGALDEPICRDCGWGHNEAILERGTA